MPQSNHLWNRWEDGRDKDLSRADGSGDIAANRYTRPRDDMLNVVDREIAATEITTKISRGIG
jgi:hypothetical protein